MADLHTALSALSCKVRSTSEDDTSGLAMQLSKAELSLVFILCRVCSSFLTGESSTFRDGRFQFFTVGDVRDLCDVIELRAHDLRISREEAEANMARSCEADMTEALQGMAESLIEREMTSFEVVRTRQVAFAEESSKGLGVIFRDAREQLFKALKSARDTRDKEGLVDCGKRGLEAIQTACANWLSWATKQTEIFKASSRPRPIVISGELAAAMARDRALNNLVVSVRKAMLLRCQQARVGALLKRVAACRDCMEILTNIERTVTT